MAKKFQDLRDAMSDEAKAHSDEILKKINQPIMWWGYIHVDGSKHVKRFFSPEDLADARESPFVANIIGPIQAPNREAAVKILFPTDVIS